MLEGSEVKSLRTGKANIAESYATVEGGELWLINGYIPAYDQAKTFGHEERRRRKLLVNKRELARLWQGDRARGHDAGAAEALLQRKRAREAAARHREGQEAGRQARHREEARLGARKGARAARAGLAAPVAIGPAPAADQRERQRACAGGEQPAAPRRGQRRDQRALQRAAVLLGL